MYSAHWILGGRVQGVFCRDRTRALARRFGATGYARNLSDGTVEVVAEAPGKEALLSLKKALKDMEPPIRVDEILGEIAECAAPKHASFSIAY